MAHTTTAQQGLDQHAVRLIRHKARQLIRRPEFSAADREDIEQELILDLLTRLPRFDASRAQRRTFVDRVVNNRVAGLVRSQCAMKRRTATALASLDDEFDGDDGTPEPRWATLEQRTTHPTRSGLDEIALRDLRLDVEVAIEDLPPELRELAEELASRSPTAAAREMGVSRRTVRDRVARIRARFERAGLQIYLQPTATFAADCVGDQ